jgi:hypothetical protein
LPPPAPSPSSECCPPPFGSKGGDPLPKASVSAGGAHSLEGEGGRGGPIRTKGQTLWYSRYSITIIPLLIRCFF